MKYPKGLFHQFVTRKLFRMKNVCVSTRIYSLLIMGFCVLQQMRSQSALVYRATSKLDLELCCFASNLIHGMRYAKNLTKKSRDSDRHSWSHRKQSVLGNLPKIAVFCGLGCVNRLLIARWRCSDLQQPNAKETKILKWYDLIMWT